MPETIPASKSWGKSNWRRTPVRTCSWPCGPTPIHGTPRETGVRPVLSTRFHRAGLNGLLERRASPGGVSGRTGNHGNLLPGARPARPGCEGPCPRRPSRRLLAPGMGSPRHHHGLQLHRSYGQRDVTADTASCGGSDAPAGPRPHPEDVERTASGHVLLPLRRRRSGVPVHLEDPDMLSRFAGRRRDVDHQRSLAERPGQWPVVAQHRHRVTVADRDRRLNGEP